MNTLVLISKPGKDMLVETDPPVSQAPTEPPLPGTRRGLGACLGFRHRAGTRQNKFTGLQLCQPQHGCPVPQSGERTEAGNAHWQGNRKQFSGPGEEKKAYFNQIVEQTQIRFSLRV